MGDIEDIDMKFLNDKYIIFTIKEDGDIMILGYRVDEEAANDYILEYIKKNDCSNVAYVIGEEFEEVSTIVREGIMNE